MPRPLVRWLQSTQQIASGNSIDAGSNATDALTEAKILDAHQATYNAGGDPFVLMIKPADSEIVAGFTAASGSNRTFNDDTRTLTATVDIMVNSFGTLKVFLNRHQLSTHAFLLDPSMWRSASCARSHALFSLRTATPTVISLSGNMA